MKKSRKQFLAAIVMYTVTSLFLFYEMAIQVSPSIMTNQLMKAFSIDSAGLGVMAAFYFYSYTGMQIPAGLLFDRYGPRTLITWACVICVLGALFFGLTETAFWAAIGRFLMGVGSAFAFIGVLVVAARWFTEFYFAFLVGVAQLLAALGAVCGEVPLAHAVEGIGWRATMFWLVGIGSCLAVLCLFVLRDHPKHESKKVMPHETSFWRHIGQVVAQFQTWSIGLYAFTGWGPVTVFASLWGVPFLAVRYNIDTFKAALAMTMMWLGVAIASPLVGWLSNLMGRRKTILWIASLVGLVSSITLIYMPDVPYFAASVLLFLMGAASASHMLTFALVRDNNRPGVVATAVGFNNMAVVIGGAILQPLVGGILTSLWDNVSMKNGVPLNTLGDYQIALIVVPLLYLIGFFVVAFSIKETYCKSKYGAHK